MTGPATAEVVGSLHRLDDRTGAVRVESTYDTSPEDLWSAVTDPERTARWVAVVEGDLRVGGDFHARFTSGWDGPGRVEVCEPPRRLLLRMEPGTDDETVIEAVLQASGQGTRLVLEERGLPLPVLAGHGAGWQAHLEDLASALAGRRPDDWRERWAVLTPSYERRAADLA